MQTRLIYNNKNLCYSKPPQSYGPNQESIILSVSEPIQNTIVIVVPSSRRNFSQRNLIRQTWGSIRIINKVHILAVVFFLGGQDAPGDEEVDVAKLEAEKSQFGDIIMGDFEDTYRNLTLKTIMVYEWLNAFCEEADLVVKTDDDVVLNIFKLTEELSTWTPAVVDSLNFWCGLHLEETIIREEDSPYRVSPEEYSGNVFPQHCAGVGYVTTMKVIQRIRKEIATSFQGIKCTHEDVFMTGIVPLKINSDGNEPIRYVDKIYEWIYYVDYFNINENILYLLQLIQQPANETLDVNEFKKRFEDKIFYLILGVPNFEKVYADMWNLLRKVYRKEKEITIRIDVL
ncbi:Beta-1,3-galactosyltransferase 5 [Pseudolycoriella hygida]|uniref:Hexosyltransferase n=1 Tax=Pseudolycoriella hygida TaxID=35572 RepID=A0A9Q0RWN8_9DIPT|nr:Beta-1,3-galactosyltransferase 5 [Pseudolycoriella hygida]